MDSAVARRLLPFIIASVSWIAPEAGASTPSGDETPFSSYPVGKRVSEFPTAPDFSTPEAAYATIMRDYMATGASGSEWSEISTTRTRLSGKKRHRVSRQKADNCQNARVVEVIIYRGRVAQVIAELKERGTSGYDQRVLFLHEDRWLNTGQDELAPTLQAARENFATKCDRIYGMELKRQGEAIPSRFDRPPITDPETYLKPYVDFLKEHGRDPHAFVMEALQSHELVTIGEIHNRPAYWAFNAELVRDPAFAESVGTVYLELPANHQENIDSFLSSGTCHPELVIDMLRDMMELGWPCEPTLKFFLAVWETNQRLSQEKRLRIRLVDMLRPWEKIQSRNDWRRYDVDRDLFMAQNILGDRQKPEANQRHGLFITGMGHAMAGLHYVDKKTPIRAAGWHLKQALGDRMLTIFQHAPAMTNRGQVTGRLALGLIDSAFAELGDQPAAFSLRHGPFGKLPFDAMPDKQAYGVFRDGYDAYLYLTPLESEILSPLIEGFYSEEFVSEIRRRRQIGRKRPAVRPITGDTILATRELYWGQPRWAGRLGPENAWHMGENWQAEMTRQRLANVQRDELTAVLDKIYRCIRQLNSQACIVGYWGKRFGYSYLTVTNLPGMHQWWRDVTKRHPLESVQYGSLRRNEDGLPQIEVTTQLQGGILFARTFAFQYEPLEDSWQAKYGLDMHLDEQFKTLASHEKEAESP